MCLCSSFFKIWISFYTKKSVIELFVYLKLEDDLTIDARAKRNEVEPFDDKLAEICHVLSDENFSTGALSNLLKFPPANECALNRILRIH